jgi:hypothetical protein
VPGDGPRTIKENDMSHQDADHGGAHGLDPSTLDDQRLLQELESVHRTRHDTFLHGARDALDAHSRRMAELEKEYLRRHPERLVTADRTRKGARAREA